MWHEGRLRCRRRRAPLVESGTATVWPSNGTSFRRLVGCHCKGLPRAHLTAFYRALLDDGRRDRSGGLAPKTVRNVHGVLRAALRDAARWGYMARNVATRPTCPRA
jgi:hypothetical protein